MVDPDMHVVMSALIGAGKYSLGHDPPAYGFLAEMVVAYADGTSITVHTNDTWVAKASAVVGENLYHGTNYDARLATPPSELTGPIPSHGWQPAATAAVPPYSGRLTPQLMPQVKALRVLKPSNVSALPDGTVLLDIGVNIAGVARLSTYPAQPAGTVVTLSFGEIVDATSGRLANPFLQTDTYTYSGTEKPGSQWTPRFVYHGFRVVAAQGLRPECAASAAAAASCVVGVEYGTALRRTGNVTFPAAPPGSEAAVLRAIHAAVVQTQQANFVSLPTDCPHREKRGWMGDAQWTAEEASLNFDTGALYANWVQSMADMQDKGCIPTKEQFSLEPPYGTCCSPTLDPLHPTVFQCSPMSNYSDTAGSVRPCRVRLAAHARAARSAPACPPPACGPSLPTCPKDGHSWFVGRWQLHCVVQSLALVAIVRTSPIYPPPTPTHACHSYLCIDGHTACRFPTLSLYCGATEADEAGLGRQYGDLPSWPCRTSSCEQLLSVAGQPRCHGSGTTARCPRCAAPLPPLHPGRKRVFCRGLQHLQTHRSAWPSSPIRCAAGVT